MTLVLFLAIDPCREHLCSQLCLLSGLRPRYYTCHCQSGWKLGDDKRTCVKGMFSYSSFYLFFLLFIAVYFVSFTQPCWNLCSSRHVHCPILDETPFLMVVRDSVIFGIPLDPTDPSNNAMAPVSGISQGKDIDFDDQEQLLYWVQSTVSRGWLESLPLVEQLQFPRGQLWCTLFPYFWLGFYMASENQRCQQVRVCSGCFHWLAVWFGFWLDKPFNVLHQSDWESHRGKHPLRQKTQWVWIVDWQYNAKIASIWHRLTKLIDYKHVSLPVLS